MTRLGRSAGPIAISPAAAVAAFVLAWLLLPAASGVLERAGLSRPNHRGRPVAKGGGLAILLASLTITAIPGLPGLMGRTHIPGIPGVADLYAFLFGSTLVGLIGLLDDVASDRTARGISGHLREFGSGRVTTGVLKLLFIAFAAVTVGSTAAGFSGGVNPYLGSSWLSLTAAVNAVIIAGTANLINLLDLRPGRALKAFLILGLIYLGLTRWPEHGYFLAAPLGAAVAVLPADLGELTRLGDVGANFLGFTVGAVVAFDFPLAPKLIFMGLIVSANVAAERVSLGSIIENNALGRFFDRLGRPPEERP